MKIKWLGQACFIVTSDKGLKLVTDPYGVTGGIRYGRVSEVADIVTVSHDHFDHSDVSSVGGQPEVVKHPGATVVRGVEVRGIAAYHDTSQGRQRGPDIIFCFSIDGVVLCHLGDLGHTLNDVQVGQVGHVDVLLVPVGGVYTVDAGGATQVCEQLGPRIIVPMHYKTSKVDFPLAGVEDFLRGKRNIRRLDSSEFEVKAGQLPATTEIVVIRPAN